MRPDDENQRWPVRWAATGNIACLFVSFNRVAIEVQTTLPGYRVLANSFYPGWPTTLANRPLEVLPADLAFRAVALPEPGTHRVDFRHFPPGLSLGLATRTTTAALLLLLRFRGSITRRRAKRPEQPPRPTAS